MASVSVRKVQSPLVKPRNKPPKRKRSGPSLAYWLVFLVCSLLSFAGGFYVSYHGTQVVVKEPPVAVAPSPSPSDVPSITAMPSPVVVDEATSEQTPAPVNPFADSVASTPSPGPSGTPFDTGVPSTVSSNGEASDTASSSANGQIFRVQVGNYDSQSSAQSMVDELSAAGVQAAVVQDDTGEYHAQIGAYTDRDRALSVADEVNAKGYSVTIRQ